MYPAKRICQSLKNNMSIVMIFLESVDKQFCRALYISGSLSWERIKLVSDKSLYNQIVLQPINVRYNAVSYNLIKRIRLLLQLFAHLIGLITVLL